MADKQFIKNVEAELYSDDAVNSPAQGAQYAASATYADNNINPAPKPLNGENANQYPRAAQQAAADGKIAELEGKLSALIQRCEGLEKQNAQLCEQGGKLQAELEATQAELGAAKSELEKSKAELEAVKAEHENAKAELGSADEKSKAAGTELEAVKAELESTKAELAKANAGLAEANREKEAVNAILEASAGELAKANAAAEEYKHKWYALSAEFDNYRKRTQAASSQSFRDGKAEAILKLLPVSDTFGYAYDGATDEKTKAGIDKIIKSFNAILLSLGVEEIPISSGDKFDESTMEAVMNHPCEEGDEPNTIKIILKKGYRQVDGKVIRFAQVSVNV